MKQIKRQVIGSLSLAAIATLSIAPVANAVEFTFTAVQERKDEVVVIDDIIENFQALERARLEERRAEADTTQQDNAQTQEENVLTSLSLTR